MAYVNAEIDLDDIDNDDIVDHVCDLINQDALTTGEVRQIERALGVHKPPAGSIPLKVVTQAERLKFELVAKLFDKIPMDLLRALDTGNDSELREVTNDIISGVYL